MKKTGKASEKSKVVDKKTVKEFKFWIKLEAIVIACWMVLFTLDMDSPASGLGLATIALVLGYLIFKELKLNVPRKIPLYEKALTVVMGGLPLLLILAVAVGFWLSVPSTSLVLSGLTEPQLVGQVSVPVPVEFELTGDEDLESFKRGLEKSELGLRADDEVVVFSQDLNRDLDVLAVIRIRGAAGLLTSEADSLQERMKGSGYEIGTLPNMLYTQGVTFDTGERADDLTVFYTCSQDEYMIRLLYHNGTGADALFDNIVNGIECVTE